jgi:hypothetical protein
MSNLEIKDLRIASESKTRFSNLAVGDLYEDPEGFICIKTNNEACLYVNEDGVWDITCCIDDEVVFPLRGHIVIEGKMTT